jgi:pyruvate,water dikinase
MFEAAAHSAALYQAGRERTKTNAVKLVHEGRMAMKTMGERMVAAGECQEWNDYSFVLEEELEDWLKAPASFNQTISERRALDVEYRALQEPFVFYKAIPDPSTWRTKGADKVDQAKPGDVLVGFPGCPGKVTGTARVVLDPLDPTALGPGDILVAPITDPAWTPLFVAAGGVIVDVGAAQSHAMIVSRELGIPCVPSVTQATRRIPDGAKVLVDGNAGTVTVLAIP